MTPLFRARYEVSFLLISLTIGVLITFSAQNLPEPNFEPLGPAAFPGVIAVATLVLSAIKIIQIFVRQPSIKEDDLEETRFSRSLTMLMIFVGFVSMVVFSNWPLWLPISLFLLASTLYLKKTKKVLHIIIQCFVILAFSMVIDLITTQILYLDI